jgi:putative peptidoglycan lipid II flippase
MNYRSLLLLYKLLVAFTVLGAWLWWSDQHWDWTALHATPLLRLGLMAGVLAVSALLYFATLTITGLKLRALLRR